jgi:hypothetical protein
LRFIAVPKFAPARAKWQIPNSTSLAISSGDGRPLIAVAAASLGRPMRRGDRRVS